MALPKAVLCILGDEPAEHPEEARLRSVGFATFAITWKELDAQPNGWIQILPPLDDPSVNAWVLVGKPADFTPEIRSKIALLTLAMTRQTPPLTVFVLSGEGDCQDVPHALDHVQIAPQGKKYAAKLMAARSRPTAFATLPFHVRAHLDPLVGAWLEIGPPQAESTLQQDAVWSGFMAGVTLAEVTAFGVGPRGILPTKSSLHFPQLGIRGTMGDQGFSACAAKNTLTAESSCFMRIEGTPGRVFCAEYPAEYPEDAPPEEMPEDSPAEGAKTGTGRNRQPVQVELI